MDPIWPRLVAPYNINDHATRFFLGYLKGSIRTDGLQQASATSLSVSCSADAESDVVLAPSEIEVVILGGAAPSSKVSSSWWNSGIGTAESSRFLVLRRWKGFLHEGVVVGIEEEGEDDDVDMDFVVRSASAQKLEGAPR